MHAMKKYRFLIVEDNDTMREGLTAVVQKQGNVAQSFSSAEALLDSPDRPAADVLISDYKLPGMTGVDLLIRLKKIQPDLEVLIITAYGTVDLAVTAMQQGASDFLTKPFSPDELALKINHVIETLEQKRALERLADENSYLRQQVDLEFNYGDIIGRSVAMQSVYRAIEKVARGDSSVIVYGESGTGKELVARAIHKASARKDRAFIRVNCGALAEGVLESELFGHEKGAFTGAHKRKKGRFELAHQGSIFLDEIGDIPAATQVKLLRVLQEKEFERVGGEETVQVDVRVIAATNKNLQEELSNGAFREDLYYRLHIIPITMPPLRARKEDIPLLADYFISAVASHLKLAKLDITDAAMARLCAYDWPGNVRELENVIERAAVLCENETIEASDLPFLSTAQGLHTTSDGGSLNLNAQLENVERRLLQSAMAQAGGVKTRAAKLLGIKTSALYYKLEKYELL